MAMSELHQQIHAALLTIKESGPKDEYLGICGNVSQIMDLHCDLDDDVEHILTELFSDWPDKSFSTAYPIGNWTNKPSKLFWHFHGSRKPMWDRQTKYGAARWALLEHCLNKLNQRE
ncbi:hypothetical protein D3C87_1563740 [compost metagenome]